MTEEEKGLWGSKWTLAGVTYDSDPEDRFACAGCEKVVEPSKGDDYKALVYTREEDDKKIISYVCPPCAAVKQTEVRSIATNKKMKDFFIDLHRYIGDYAIANFLTPAMVVMILSSVAVDIAITGTDMTEEEWTALFKKAKEKIKDNKYAKV